MPSPTVSALAAQPGASFIFRCRPCNRVKAYRGAELVARVGPEETWQSLRARTVCPKCKMPVDGDFRTFDYHCTTDDPRHGWSGPK